MGKKLFFISILSFFIVTSCDLIQNKSKKAIEVCQQSKVQIQTEDFFEGLFLNMYGLSLDATWLDFANFLAQQEPNTKYDWAASKTDQEGIYMVSFADELGWGHRWEVTLDEQIVKHVNSNEYLTRKYELSRMGKSEEFTITKILTDTLRITGNSSKEVIYEFKGSVINNTDKSIIEADITGILKLIFEEKTISGESSYYDGFISTVSKSKPWKPGEEREFKLKTDGIEFIYAEYTPPYALFEISLIAEDPVGYVFDENIAEYDLVEKWVRLTNVD